MKLYGAWVLIAALVVTGCNESKTPAPAPTSVATAEDAPPEIPVMGREVRILALGDSLFAGYGLQRGEGYPESLEAALRARGVNAKISNAGVSGDTTAGGLQRLAFTLNSQTQKPDLVIISLGGNDMLRGLQPQATRENLDAMLAELKKQGIPVMLMGMLAPPNLGADYRKQFDPIYPALAAKYKAALVPFFLQSVIDRPELLQQDHIHPTAQGIAEIVGATAPEVVKALPKDAAATGEAPSAVAPPSPH